MNLFEAFGIEEPEAVTVKEVKKKKATTKKTEKKKTTAVKTAGTEIDVTHETIIRFEGITHPITVYFTDEEIEEGILENDKRRKITTEDVRKRMELGIIQLTPEELNDLGLGGLSAYIDLVPSITKFHIEKEKNMIIPVKQAGKKGSGGSSSPSLPKIPYQLIMEFWKWSRYYAENYQVEIHADVYFDRETRKYVLDYPEQQCSYLNVEVTYTNPMLSAEMKKILEIHSHHRLAPWPSLQDDKTERFPNQLYMIVGRYKEEDRENKPYLVKLGDLYPEITLRTFLNGKHIPLHVWDFVEHPFCTDELAPLPQLEVVK